MPTDDELDDYARMLVERFDGMDLPELAPEHRLGTEGRHGWVSDLKAIGMQGIIVCFQCGNKVRDHPHCWCDMPPKKGWVPAPAMAEHARKWKKGRTPFAK